MIHAVLLQPVVSPDGNDNGIDDVLEVAGQPGAFADDNTPLPTYRIDCRRERTSCDDLRRPAPDGVRITVAGTGTSKATFSVCGMTLKLAPGSEVVVTCGSLTVSVIAGRGGGHCRRRTGGRDGSSRGNCKDR